MKRNAARVVKDMLCCGCGTCVAVCPAGAIVMRETASGLLQPRVRREDCTWCGMCLEVCPGLHPIYWVGQEQGDSFEGPVLGAYVGWASDNTVLAGAQSGGAATGILLWALEDGVIDKVVVTRYSSANPLRPETIITDSVTDIIEAQGSKYSPVAAGELIRVVAESDCRVAFVGLPCHIQALHRARSTGSFALTNLVFTLGLFCEGISSYLAIDYLLKCMRLRPAEVRKFEFKGKAWRGWPGDVRALTVQGEAYNLPRSLRIFAKPFFKPLRCRICHDKLNTLADVALGDAWGIREIREEASAIITRTDLGEQLLQGVQASGKLKLVPVDKEKVLGGQGIGRHRRMHGAFLWAWNRIGISSTRVGGDWHQPSDSPGIASRAGALLVLLTSLLLQSRAGVVLLKMMPPWLPVLFGSMRSVLTRVLHLAESLSA